MQLIIPMSGLGERFLNAGYLVPKPLIEVENKTIISHVINMFPSIDSVIFICNKNHLNNKVLNMEQKLLKASPKAKIFAIDQHKKGPIYAVLKIINKLNLEIPTIVNYCDFNCIWNFQEFKTHVLETNCDGCIVTYTGFHPHMLGNINYAYLKKENSYITDIQEKKPFTSNPMSEYASSGTYYFKSGVIMKKYFNKTIEEDLSVKNEYYVSLSFKPMIKDNLKLNNFNIKYFMQWGTPIDLEEYKWFSNLFRKKIIKQKNKLISEGILLMPCAGLGKRFYDAGYNTPKPLIEVSEKPMILRAINDLPNFEKVKIIFRNDLIHSNQIKKLVKKNIRNSEVQFINFKTSGQASTCLIGLEEKDLNKPLLISACDNGTLYDQEKFINLQKDLSIDIIVWGCRNYPGARKNPNMYGWIDEKQNIIKKVHVKKPIGEINEDPIITGTFFFRKSEIFKTIAEKLIRSNQRINNEFYVDSCINNAIDIGYKVVFFEVDFYLCWGTPDDLKTYQYWQDCFSEWSDHPYKKEIDNDF